MKQTHPYRLKDIYRHPAWPLALFILAVMVRAASMAYTAQSPVFWAPTSDELEHWNLAVHLAEGDWLGREWGPYHRPQLFAYMLGGLVWLFGAHFWMVHVFVGLCDSAAVVVWHAAARRAMGRGAAALAGLIVALYWPFVHFAGTGYMESFAMLLNAGLILGLAEHARRAAWWARRGGRFGAGRWDRSPWPPLMLAGVMAGLSLMTRPQTLIVLPVLAAWLVWIAWRHQKRISKSVRRNGSPLGTAPPTLPPPTLAPPTLAPPTLAPPTLAPPIFQIIYKVGVGAVVFLALAGLVAAPNAVRHAALFKLWAPLGTGSELAFAMSNNADGVSWATTSPGVEFQAFQQTPFVEAGVPTEIAPTRAFWAQRNREYLRGHFGHFLTQFARKLLMTLNAYEVHCTQNFKLLRGVSPVLRWLPGFEVLAPFGLAGLGAVLAGWMRRRWQRGRRARPGEFSGNTTQREMRLMLAAWVVVYLLGVALFLAIARHRLPALPPLLLLGAWAMERMAGLARRAPGRLAWWIAGLALAIVLTRLPVIPANYPEHERWWSQVNVGVALLQLDDPVEAEAALRDAVAILPEKPEGWRQLSIAMARQGRPGEAAETQREAARLIERLYPRHAGLLAQELETSARLEAEAGNLAAAERDARRVVELAPGVARGHNLLAVMLLRQDRAREALPVIARALELEPENEAARTNLRRAVDYLQSKGEAVELPESVRGFMGE